MKKYLLTSASFLSLSRTVTTFPMDPLPKNFFCFSLIKNRSDEEDANAVTSIILSYYLTTLKCMDVHVYISRHLS